MRNQSAERGPGKTASSSWVFSTHRSTHSRKKVANGIAGRPRAGAAKVIPHVLSGARSRDAIGQRSYRSGKRNGGARWQPRFQPPPSRRRTDLGRHLLAKEFFGLADFSVPLLQLVRSQETHDPLANLVAVGS